MVSPGHASKGCVNCKARRIKCDETWPNCRRCIASGRTCLGYRGQTRRIIEDAQRCPGLTGLLPCGLSLLLPGRQHFDIVTSAPSLTRSVARSASDTDNSKVDSSERLEKSSGIQDQTPAKCILDTVAICFEGLWDSAQSRETRSLLLQSYHNALRILRVALLSDPHDQKLITPTRSLAVYEVCCFESASQTLS